MILNLNLTQQSRESKQTHIIYILFSIFFISAHVITGKPNSKHDTEEGEEDGRTFIFYKMRHDKSDFALAKKENTDQLCSN